MCTSRPLVANRFLMVAMHELLFSRGSLCVCLNTRGMAFGLGRCRYESKCLKAMWARVRGLGNFWVWNFRLTRCSSLQQMPFLPHLSPLAQAWDRHWTWLAMAFTTRWLGLGVLAENWTRVLLGGMLESIQLSCAAHQKWHNSVEVKDIDYLVSIAQHSLV